MTVDFADRMKIAILRKNYHTVPHLYSYGNPQRRGKRPEKPLDINGE